MIKIVIFMSCIFTKNIFLKMRQEIQALKSPPSVNLAGADGNL